MVHRTEVVAGGRGRWLRRALEAMDTLDEAERGNRRSFTRAFQACLAPGESLPSSDDLDALRERARAWVTRKTLPHGLSPAEQDRLFALLLEDEPTEEERIQRTERLREAAQVALDEWAEATRDPSPWLCAYDAHPATGGGKGIIGDLLLEGAHTTARYPGLGPESGMLPGVTSLSESLGRIVLEREEARLQAIPNERRDDYSVLIVFGPPSAGKTTAIERLSRHPGVALLLESVGGDLGYMHRQTLRFLRMGFNVELVALLAPLEITSARAAHRAFVIHRPVACLPQGRLYLSTLEALHTLQADMARGVYPEGRVRLGVMDTGHASGGFREIRSRGDLSGVCPLLDRFLEGAPPDLGSLQSLAIDWTLAAFRREASLKPTLNPEIIAFHARELTEQTRDPRAGSFLQVWREAHDRLLPGRRSLPGDPGPARADWTAGSSPGRVGALEALVAPDAPADADRTHEIYEDVLEMAKAGVQQGPIHSALLRKLQAATHSRADLLAGLQDALDESDGRTYARVLKAVMKRFCADGGED